MKQLHSIFSLTLIVLVLLSACKKDDVTPTSTETADTTGTIDSTDTNTPGTTMSVQARLDSGQTPFEIYQDDNDNLNELYGASYEGGIIAYLNTEDGSGFVAIESYIDTVSDWGCSNKTLFETVVLGTETTYIPIAIGSSIGAGKYNTDAIAEKCFVGVSLYTAGYTVDGFGDWVVPSTDEMIEVSKNLASKIELHDSYWTSTQENVLKNAKVYAVNTEDHSASLVPKVSSVYRAVCLIRSF